MDLPIYNINDLQAEIARLKGVEQEQKAALGARFASPGAVFSTALSLFPKNAATDGLKHQDFVGLLSRFVLPLALNKTVFRNSNFLIKTLVGLASQKASEFISEDSVTNVWDKARGLLEKIGIGKKDKKPKAKDLTGFGIEKTGA